MGEFHESPVPKIPPNKNKYLKNQKQNKKTRKFIISFACPYHSRTENCKKYFPRILYLTILWDLKFYLYLWLLSIFNTSLKTVKIYVNKKRIRDWKMYMNYLWAVVAHRQPADQLNQPDTHFVQNNLTIPMNWIHWINWKQIQTDQLQLRSPVTQQKKQQKVVSEEIVYQILFSSTHIEVQSYLSYSSQCTKTIYWFQID